ncbi:MAG: hypothetical protein Q9208_003302 [Pyrenodesmia sp. 3 TL-2023]
MPKRKYPPSQSLLDALEAKRLARITIKTRCILDVRSPSSTFSYRLRAPHSEQTEARNDAKLQRIVDNTTCLMMLGEYLGGQEKRKDLGKGKQVEVWKEEMRGLTKKVAGWEEELVELQHTYIVKMQDVHGR